MSLASSDHLDKTVSSSRSRCQLLEIVQYSCEPEKLPSGAIRPHCFPIPRIFRICPDRPAQEITKFTTIDMKTGEIELPDQNNPLPKAKRWQDVHLYSNTEAG
ncbi:hypothetical protein HYDPIDRAFT_112675 [Hydnomerulius pinastri MD-312]|uniref:Uncharacterized protein n=1 Tax=Hydnomerulius pinastri MD-312 TaxID=994086 RepID=A0A0C9W8F6_9AGAM|nr:hypothetical protein HYDPIDRAFT_112675 [Hydnomerulius pinastri MD-312]